MSGVGWVYLRDVNDSEHIPQEMNSPDLSSSSGALTNQAGRSLAVESELLDDSSPDNAVIFDVRV